MQNIDYGLRKTNMPDYGKPIIRILCPVLISILSVLFLISFSCQTERQSCRNGKLEIISKVFSQSSQLSSYKLFNYQTLGSNESSKEITTEVPIFKKLTIKQKEEGFWEDKKTAIAYAASFIFILAILTFAIFIVLYYQINSIIYLYFAMVIFFGMTFLTLILFNQISKIFYIRLDWLTILFFIYNVNMLGYCIFKQTDEETSKLARKVYGLYLSILVSSFAVIFVPPEISVFFLVVIIFWDLFAVLSPYGPLKLILNLMNEREQNPTTNSKTPGHISELMLFSTMLSNKSINFCIDTTKTDEIEAKRKTSKKLIPLNIDGSLDPSAERNVKKHGSENCIFVQKDLDSMAEIRPQLGMGDFIFYNLLVSKFSLIVDSWFFVLVCIIAIIFGLTVTLITLIALDMALPALPIPIVFALIIAGGMRYLGGLEMLDECNGRLIFI